MRRGTALLLVVLAAVLGLPAPGADAYPGAPWFEASKPYTANFPDPSVVLVGSTYHAYGTSTGGAYLPVMTSSDLRTWTARPAYDPGPPLNRDRFFNDALPYPASWAADRPVSGRMTKEVWAPGVAVIGGRSVAFYSVLQRISPPRYCISVAVADSPLGPFTDRSTGPLVCDADPAGSIDPQPFVDTDGTPWLLWKSEGVPGSAPTRIWSRRLDATGTAFAPGSAPVELLRTSLGWEGDVIENPSMVRWNGRLHLFYSANEHRSAAYAIGYADCASPSGPCTKSAANPVLASRGDRLGPGGPAAFLDRAGQLQLAHHWWNAPYTDYPAFPACQSAGTCTGQGQRRLAVEPVFRGDDGTLRVGGTPPPVARDTADACPGARVPEDGFGDVVAGSTHEAAVDCAVWWQVAAGVRPGTYDPSRPVTRDQMAAFLARLVERSGGTLPANPPDRFPDDEGSIHEPSINALAAAGVVNGRSDGTYGPSELVTRAQMATFLVRAYERRAGATLPAGPDAFSDDEGSTHEASIDRAAAAGFTGGTAGGGYRPLAPVPRDAMATFLTRVLDLLVERNGARPPG